VRQNEVGKERISICFSERKKMVISCALAESEDCPENQTMMLLARDLHVLENLKFMKNLLM
jgi:hypothetical protein